MPQLSEEGKSSYLGRSWCSRAEQAKKSAEVIVGCCGINRKADQRRSSEPTARPVRQRDKPEGLNVKMLLMRYGVVLMCDSLTRPKISLHLLIHNPVSNLHFNFNPKYCLQFLNPSLWSGA